MTQPTVPARPFANVDRVPVLVSDDRPGTVRRHALYRHYDQAGNLLYVGITNNPLRRWLDHACRSPWVTSRLVAWIEIVWFPDESSAAVAEREAIAKSAPLFNKRRRGGPARGRLAAYLAAGGPAAAAVVLGTPRRVRCRYVPGTTCVSCGPDFEELFA
jgi:hypothetical protein